MKTIKINGTDYTALCIPHTYGVNYEAVLGPAGGVMINGVLRQDVLAYRPIVTMGFIPLTDAQARALLTDIQAADTAELYYYDTKQGYRTMKAAYEMSDMTAQCDLVGGDYWIGLSVVFTDTLEEVSG